MDPFMRPDPRDLLVSIISRKKPDLLLSVRLLEVLDLNNADRKELRDIGGLELLEEGLDENGNHNSYGLKLEGLIDLLLPL